MFLRDDNKIGQIEDKFLRVLFGKINTLLTVQNIPKDSEANTAAEHKAECDALLRSLLEYLGVGDSKLTTLKLREEETLEVKMGNATMTARNEFQLVNKNIYATPLYAWVEDKSYLLKDNTAFIETVAQKAAEAIVIGLFNRKASSDQSQEVFGLGLRHRYFSFWHSWMPAHYLAQLHKAPTGLGPEDFAWCGR